jgi:hypothetical protein
VRFELRLSLDHRPRDLSPGLAVADEEVTFTVGDGRVEGGVDVGAGDVGDGDVELLRWRQR